ncbi:MULTISPECIES: riboflavin synthase subunit beta [Aequorivita]|uniref:Riboflavin synthase subunit beta n=1 Tax=Aequorivita iocasae TaxID=2803865 RepID=A0ABX7DRH4_9FLAO|nr:MULTISPECIES: riboflavin synthase subunit beta [Aequorivita]QQX76608.1 riboflavin synthase subunit beta [Aequorivita iocasae]UCA56079.1 riboflavin synthase subunit beta [Aequorivita sp. F7]
MGLIGKRKNKKYSYKPRHYEFDGDGSPFSMGHKFDEFRTTVGDNKGLKGKFKTAWADLRQSSDRNANRRLIIIIAILILLFLFIIDFDLSIFYA